MCGITGFCDFTKKLNKEHLIQLTDSLSHRGPDDAGHELFESPQATVGIGNRRLSIIDLSAHGHQPFVSIDKRYTLTFNGTIYNYEELREELLKKGYTFSSATDTEVLLYAYAEWRNDVIQKLDGIFAFVIYDHEKQTLFFARDKAGVKPFYYLYDNERFIFASEIRAFTHLSSFKKSINKNALNYFFQLGYVPSPLSIFEGINKLPPASSGELKINERSFSISNYWNIADETKTIYNKPEEELTEELNQLYKHAANKRLVGDKDVGVLMSGGFDSTLLAALLSKQQKIKTITVGFEDKNYNEVPNAEAIARYLGTDQTSKICSEENIKEIVLLLPKIFDEPVSDSGAIPQVMAFQTAREQGLSLILSADGNDELFYGYEKYNKIKEIQTKLKSIPPFIRKPLSLLVPVLPVQRKQKLASLLNDSSEINIHFQMISIFSPNELKLLLKQNIYRPIKNELYPNGNIYHNDFRYYMTEHILTGADKVSMWYGIESREPFLDNDIIHFAANTPFHLKQKGRTLKYIVRQVAYKHIPKDLLDQPKKGFASPIAKLLRNELKEIVLSRLLTAQPEQHLLINYSYAQLIIDKFFRGNDDSYASKVWALFTFQCWYDEWMGIRS